MVLKPISTTDILDSNVALNYLSLQCLSVISWGLRQWTNTSFATTLNQEEAGSCTSSKSSFKYKIQTSNYR